MSAPVIPLPSAALPKRTVILAMSRGAKAAEVIEEILHGQRRFIVVVRSLFRDTQTITTWHNSHDAIQQARLEIG